MYITTKRMDIDTMRSLIARVSREQYDSNLRIEALERTRGNQYRLKLGTTDSRGAGSRTSASGRHGRYACWHAFRDVFAELFMTDPDMTIRTGMATYRGAKGFLDTYPGTVENNIGSMVRPAYIDELCECRYDNQGNAIDELERAAR